MNERLCLISGSTIGASIGLIIFSVSLLEPSALPLLGYWLLGLATTELVFFGLGITLSVGLIGALLMLGLWYLFMWIIKDQSAEPGKSRFLLSDSEEAIRGSEHTIALVRLMEVGNNELPADFNQEQMQTALKELEAWNEALKLAIERDDLLTAERQLKSYYHRFALTYHPDKTHWNKTSLSKTDREALFQRCQGIYEGVKKTLEEIKNPSMDLQIQWRIIQDEQEKIKKGIDALEKEFQQFVKERDEEIQQFENEIQQVKKEQAETFRQLNESMPQKVREGFQAYLSEHPEQTLVEPSGSPADKQLDAGTPKNNLFSFELKK